MRSILVIVLGGLLVGCATASLPQDAVAQSDIPNVLVLGEDSDRDTVPRNSRVFDQVVDALANQMNIGGYNVYDETVLTMDTYTQDRVRRTDQEVIDIARSISRPPIDVTAIFSIYASRTELDYTTKVRTRITGRLLNPRSGQRMGNFEVVSPEELRAPLDCSRECLLELLSEQGRILGSDLGNALVEQLDNMWVRDDIAAVPGSGMTGGSLEPGFVRQYELTFDGFTANDMLDIEEYLVVFSGYQAHRPLDDRGTYHSYWYESSISAAKLNRNLNRLLDRLDLSGRVQSSGEKVTVTKIAKRQRHPVANDEDW